MLKLMLALVTAALMPPLPQVGGKGQTARLFATVGMSEFCPHGNVSLDVTSGRYEFTPRAPRRICNDANLERPVYRGVLPHREVETIRAAYARVLSEGLGETGCNPEGAMVVSNGGTPILVITTGAYSASAPDDAVCRSDAANALLDILEEIFASRQGR